MAEHGHGQPDVPGQEDLETLSLLVEADLYRAFQRCVWILVHETGRSRVEIMNEMVRDFLVKHEC